jgi:hypothetical protein
LRLALLKRNQQFVWAFDFVFGREEFFTPWFTCALGALINGVANSKTVIAGPLRAAARKLVTYLARLEELAFERPMLAPQFALTDDAHNLLLTTSDDLSERLLGEAILRI